MSTCRQYSGMVLWRSTLQLRVGHISDRSASFSVFYYLITSYMIIIIIIMMMTGDDSGAGDLVGSKVPSNNQRSHWQHSL